MRRAGESTAAAFPAATTAWTRAGDLLFGTSRYTKFLLLSPIAIFLLAFFLFPLLWMARISLAANPGGTGFGEGHAFYIPGTWTVENYVKFFTDPFFLDLALFTIQFGVLTAFFSTVLSYALAYQIYRSGPLMKSALLMIVIMPKFTNVLVLMYGFLVIFGSNGLINNFLMATGIIGEPIPMLYNLFSVVLGEIILVMPYCVLIIVAVLHTIDRSLPEAAEGLGANPARTFLEIILPLSLPGVWVSLLLSVIWGLGAFVAPYLLGTPDLYTLAVEVERQTNWRLNWAMGATIGFILMAIILSVVVVLGLVQRRQAAAPAGAG